MGKTTLKLIFFFYLLLTSCDQEAFNFDLSKEIEIRFDFDLRVIDQILPYDTAVQFLIKENDLISSYKKYAESYHFNRISYAIVGSEINNSADFSSIKCSYNLNNNLQSFIDLANISLVDSSKQTLEISDFTLTQMSELADSTGQLELTVQINPNLQPAKFSLILYFDTTVAVSFN